ncbi:MAG: PKD domain-containing protein [Chitinophagales bacterium]
MNRIFTPALLSMLCIFTIASFAQSGVKYFKGSEATLICKGASQVIMDEERNTVSFIRLQQNESIPVSKAKDWLKNEVLKLPATHDLVQYQELNDNAGFTHFRYREHYKGVPVEYGVYYIHTRGEKVKSANGEWYEGIALSTTPSLTASQAYQAACNYMNAKTWSHEIEEADNNKLMILPIDGSYKLVYKCDVYAKEPWNREWIYVDAQNGSIAKTESRIHSTDVPGTAVTAYSGTRPIISDSIGPNNFRLREYTRGAGVETFDVSEPNDFTGPSKDWDYNGGFDIYALDAHFGCEATYDYYNDNYGWKSVDGAGNQKLKSLVHNGPGINAFWDGTYMKYLDGDASQGVTPLTSLDVCGHELTHGVTEHSSGLIYSCESGSINEAMSDIFGVTIRFLNIPNGTWFIGDQFNYTLRDMSNPNDYNNPDCYGGLYWSTCPEVHSGSGVANLWYYLLTEGGTGVNDVGYSYAVDAIGLVNAGAITFRSNTVYLTPNSDFLDFRNLSIQAAQDLFGDCSIEAYQTVNAWLAVNVGGEFDDVVSAAFSAPQTSFCTTSGQVSFVNESLNGTSYEWDFGDGTTSTEQNPVHIYTDEGVYTVSLIVNGVAACGTTDTLVVPEYVMVENVGQAVPAFCTPATTQPSTGFGVFKVKFGDINHTSVGSIEGYQDYSCASFTHVVAGDPVVLTVNTGPGKSEDLHVWIDYNGDGAFNETNELVFVDDVGGEIHTGTVFTSAFAILNTPLRMRVIDDKGSNNISNSCYSSQFGQAEDYMIIFEAVSAAPIADFTSDVTSVNFGGTVNYFDLSMNVPSSWEWHFEGGIPETSTAQHPTGIVYNDVGTFDVSLKVTNVFGTNIIVKTDYITVNPVFNVCDLATVTLPTGTFYDTGGPDANYQNNENCTLLLAPPCAGSVTLNFSSFASQANNDFLKVYDGTDASAPLLLSVSGFPFPLPSVTGNSGKLFITWTSTVSQVNSGYAATFTSQIGGNVTPVADFSISNSNPAYNTQVDFADMSTNDPIDWVWDFGDGGSSNQPNPSHIFAGSGSYNVKMVSSNCGGADSIIKTVNVQASPIIKVNPANLTVDLTCNTTTATVPITITNDGGGDLVYEVLENEYNFEGTQPNILVITYGADPIESYPNTISAINTYYPNNTITEINTTNAEDLAAALQDKNVCLITKAIGIETDYLNYAVPLQEFVNNGGTVILCGTSSSKVSCLFNTGLLSGSYGALATNNPLSVINTTHPITQSLGSEISDGPKNSHSLNLTSGIIDLITFSGGTVVGYEDIGFGHVVYIGFDYKIVETASGVTMGNTLSWINSMLVADWVSLNPSGGGTLVPGGSQVINVTVNSGGLANGTYTEYIVFNSNDPNNPTDTVLLTVNVETGNCVYFNAIQGCEGQICFDDSIQTGATSVAWTFGDGGISVENDPCHTYASSGSYNVQLIACGTEGCDTVNQTIDVVILAAAVGYSPIVVYENDIVSFTSNSSGALIWNWTFGDGGTSTLENPTHVYAAEGIYTVTLVAKDAAGCSVTTMENITILDVGIDDPGYNFGLNIYPNPFNSQAVIEYTLPQSSSVNIELWNALGQKISVVLEDQIQQAGTYVYPVTIAEAGVYMVRFSVGDTLVWKKLVRVN